MGLRMEYPWLFFSFFFFFFFMLFTWENKEASDIPAALYLLATPSVRQPISNVDVL